MLVILINTIPVFVNKNWLPNKLLYWKVCNIYMCNIVYSVVMQTSGTFPILGKHIHSLLAWVTGINDISPEASSSKNKQH
jgi:hypothetical protein